MKTVVGFILSRMLLAGKNERNECGKVEVSYLPFCLANLKILPVRHLNQIDFAQLPMW